MTQISMEHQQRPRDLGTLLQKYLPEFLNSDQWLWLTVTERAGLHLALGTATTWIEKGLREGEATRLIGYAGLLEDLASSGNPAEANAVAIDSLELLDWSDPALAKLLIELGPSTSVTRRNRLDS